MELYKSNKVKTMAEEIEDVEVEVKEDTMSKVLDRIEAIEKLSLIHI